MGKMGRELLSILVEAKFPAPFLLSDLLPPSNIVNFSTMGIATVGIGILDNSVPTL